MPNYIQLWYMYVIIYPCIIHDLRVPVISDPTAPIWGHANIMQWEFAWLRGYHAYDIIFLHSGPARDGRAAPVARGVRM